MNTKTNTIKKLRLFLLKQISSLTAEQLNTIPAGFNNNIIWNIAHLLSAAQAICYKRAGLPITVDDQYVTPFLTGTKPNGFISHEEIETIKMHFISSIDTLQTDVEKEIFGNYTKSENIERVYGIELLTIDLALEFLLYHEGAHIGYILAMKHLV